MFHRQIVDKLTNIINKIRKAKILMQSINASLYCCIYEFLIYLIIMINNDNNNEFLFN